MSVAKGGRSAIFSVAVYLQVWKPGQIDVYGYDVAVTIHLVLSNYVSRHPS